MGTFWGSEFLIAKGTEWSGQLPLLPLPLPTHSSLWAVSFAGLMPTPHRPPGSFLLSLPLRMGKQSWGLLAPSPGSHLCAT